jgi:hypothetical protein
VQESGALSNGMTFSSLVQLDGSGTDVRGELACMAVHIAIFHQIVISFHRFDPVQRFVVAPPTSCSEEEFFTYTILPFCILVAHLVICTLLLASSCL